MLILVEMSAIVFSLFLMLSSSFQHIFTVMWPVCPNDWGFFLYQTLY